VQRRELLISRLQTPFVRLASNFAGSRRARASCAPAGLKRTRHETRVASRSNRAPRVAKPETGPPPRRSCSNRRRAGLPRTLVA
jgi:hypothetical protein